MRKPYEFQLGAQSDRLQPFHQFSSHRLTNSRGRSVVDSGFEQLLSERGYVKNVSSAVSRVTKRCSGCLGNPTPTEAALEPA